MNSSLDAPHAAGVAACVGATISTSGTAVVSGNVASTMNASLSVDISLHRWGQVLSNKVIIEVVVITGNFYLLLYYKNVATLVKSPPQHGQPSPIVGR